MRNLFFLIFTTVVFCASAQNPGFRKLYLGDNTAATFVDILWDGEKLITTGQFLTDTAPNNALNGLLYLELDTNGNTLFTDIYFHPNHAIAIEIGNNMSKIDSQIYITGPIYAQGKKNLFVTYTHSERTNLVVLENNDGLSNRIRHVVKNGENLLMSGFIQNISYVYEGMLIKSDPLGNEIWRKYYGEPNIYCSFAEPYVIDANNILLPGFKYRSHGAGPVTNSWTKSWVLIVDSLGNVKSEWESPKNVENGISTRMLKTPEGNWLYVTAEYDFLWPQQNDDYSLHPKIVCRDSNFNLIWEQYAPAFEPHWECYLTDLMPTSDGNYVAVGFLTDFFWLGAQVIYKFNSAGEKVWIHKDYCQPDTGCAHYLGGVCELPGGSIVAAGYYQNLIDVGTYGLLIKVDRNGCLDTFCVTNNTKELSLASRVKIFPNPTVAHITIQHPIGDQVIISDQQGRPLRAVPVTGESLRVDIADLPDGVYIVTMQEKTLRVSWQIVKAKGL